MKLRIKLSRKRKTRIGLKQIIGALKVIKIMKNWPVYFKDFLGILKNQNLIYKLRNGVLLLIRSDSFERNIFNEVWIYSEYNPKGFEINKNDVVLDIGANVGIFSIYAASKARNGKVYAFEPVKENFKSLLKNINLNNAKNIVPFNLGVSDKTTKREIFVSNINFGGNSFYETIIKEQQAKKEVIKTISLKEIFKKNKIDRINFLKCDCEGAEYEIFFAARELLNKIDKISMEVHYLDKERNIGTIKNLLEKSGFLVKVVPDITIQNKLNLLYAKRK